MRPVTRIWAWTAVCVAVLATLRGFWPLALAVFLLSPAPAWVFAGRGSAAGPATAAWLRAIGIAAAVLALVYVAVVAMGGLPQVHEWRGLLSGAR